jgi:acetylornithine deacetylase/succinyl-diaminopimelate desuccinylase-like protein
MEWQKKVLAEIDRTEVAELAVALGNIYSPPGMEAAVGDFLCDWLESQGFAHRKVAMVPERPNIVATLPGSGTGLSLLFNAHMDTSKRVDDQMALRQPIDPVHYKAWIDGEYVVGEGVVNDKGPMAAFLIAAAAIKRAGVPLLGDLILSMVVGEIGQEPVDEFEAPGYLSKELGTRYVVSRGVVADYALVAEGTQFRTAWTGAGKLFVKVTIYGQGKYTPYVTHPEDLAENRNAIVQAVRAVETLDRWAARYEVEHRLETEGGTVIPKASVNAIRGGNPHKLISTSAVCYLYVDIRLNPNARPTAILRELRNVLTATGVAFDLEPFVYRKGQTATGLEPLLDGLRQAHSQVFGGGLEMAKSGISSMWRDHIPLIEAGIPALTYGPGQATGGPTLALSKEDLEKAAQVYALTALDICMRPAQ